MHNINNMIQILDIKRLNKRSIPYISKIVKSSPAVVITSSNMNVALTCGEHCSGER